MAFDGVSVACVVKELRDKLIDTRINKIAQPERDELLLTFKVNREQLRLKISVEASLPIVHFVEENKKSPLTAPNFCMLLRKYIQSGRIVQIDQVGLERIIRFEIEHLDELGELCTKFLIIELMGKHSNIIFINSEGVIIDSIKRISAVVSSLREVYPGKVYFLPEELKKVNPLKITEDLDFGQFDQLLAESAQPLAKTLVGVFEGFSPILAQELCMRAEADSQCMYLALEDAGKKQLYEAVRQVMLQIKEGAFSPSILYQKDVPYEFVPFPFAIYEGMDSECYDSISKLLANYYEKKSSYTRVRQKTADLRKVVMTALERNVKKYDLQNKQLQDTLKRDHYKLCGELLNVYGYGQEEGKKEITVENYYTNEPMKITLDPDLTLQENAKRYYDKYSKQKRTYEALSILIEETGKDVEHLKSILSSLDHIKEQEDVAQIRDELEQHGYLKKRVGVKKEKIVSKPYHFVSSDGFHMYVGKNNYQNDELTFQVAQGGDWWFHAKGMPGSHVIVKTLGKELPDRTFEEAGRLAAYYSSGKDQEKVWVDYVLKKFVKKPPKAKPGFVIYDTNYSLAIQPSIEGIARENN